MKKRFFQLVLTAVLSVSCVATGVNVSAAPLSSEGYSIEKVSHPERGAGETDGILSFDAMGEESNRNQSYVWSCVEHGNYIYLGTCWNPISGIYYRNLKNNLTKLFQNRGDENPAQKAGTVATNILNVVYNGNFPDGATSTNGTPCIMRVNKYTYETEVVYIEKESSAFVNWNGYRMAVEYNGKLYFACAGMQFAANELRNYFTNHEEGYTPSTDAEKDAERTEFLKALYYTWYGSDYAPVLSRAYDETFTENGSPIDLAPYFHTYVLGKEVEGVAYKMTYYADDNGAVGEELSEVPSKAGTYHAKAELVMDDVSAYGEPCKKVTLDGETYSLPLARGWTTYTIQAKDDPENPKPENPDPENPDKPDPGTPDDPKNPGSDNPGQNLKPNQNLNNNKNTTKNININKSTNGKASNKAAARTGDQSPVWMYTLLSLAALAVIAAVICKRRFRR